VCMHVCLGLGGGVDGEHEARRKVARDSDKTASMFSMIQRAAPQTSWKSLGDKGVGGGMQDDRIGDPFQLCTLDFVESSEGFVVRVQQPVAFEAAFYCGECAPVPSPPPPPPPPLPPSTLPAAPAPAVDNAEVRDPDLSFHSSPSSGRRSDRSQCGGG
jgi:hypothetical protein